MNSNVLRLFYHSFIVVFLVMLSITSFAQVGQNNFKYLNPTPLGASFFDVSFYDNNNGIAVGNASSIARTTDAGTTWTYGVVMFNAASGLKQRPVLNDVHFISPTIAYAVGDSGMLIKTTDGGVNWTQINNPLYATGRALKALHFLNKDTGYIGGQAQNLSATTATELDPNVSPKLYFTKNGGATWDSLSAPVGAPTMLGFIASPTNQPLKKQIIAVGKTINRILFTSANTGFVVGDNGGGSSLQYSVTYPGGSSNSSTWHAPLIWKFSNGTLTDYSITKEKFGVTGINAGSGLPPTATTTYGNVLPFTSQTLWSITPINDSNMLVGASNGYVFRIKTGVNDSTALAFNPAYTPNLAGVFAKGKYEFSNFSLNNSYPTQAVPPLPPVPNRFLFSTVNNMKKAPDGKIYCNHGVNAPLTTVATSTDNGVTWSLINATPGYTVSAATVATTAMDITQNGTIHFMGVNGFNTKSTNGSTWVPNYKTASFNPGLNKMEFADCNNGAVLGNQGVILATTDGGKNWADRTIASFGPTVSILGMSFPDAGRLYFTATNGNIYSSPDIGTTINLLFTPSRVSNNYGLATWGTGATTRIWATSIRFSDPVNRSVVYRSLNNGATWDTIKAFSTMGTNTPQVIKFTDANTGYMAAGKAWLWKTTDGGTTWANISPDPALTASAAFGGLHSIGVFGNTIYYWCLVSTTRYLYKSTNGGATWSANIFPITVANEEVTNIGDFVMHDENNFIALTGPSKILITNDGGATWRFDEAPSGTSFNAGQFIPKVVPAGTAMANRKMLVTGNQIFEYGTGAINVSSTEVLTASCTTSNNGAITVSASGGIAPYTYSIDGGTFQTANTFNNISVGNHTIAVKDAGCGPDYTKTITVATRPSPVISAGPPRTIVNGDAITLDGFGVPTFTTLLWTPATSITSGANTYTPTVKPTATTNYILTVIDNNGCVGASNALVTVIPYCIKIQNAFSPNGDGINDKWIVISGNTCINKIVAAVYNRYGSLIYKNDNYQNNWDGTYNGKPVTDGTYYYQLNVTLINGSLQSFKGDVSILR
jgi:gliding motility-associated-like protein